MHVVPSVASHIAHPLTFQKKDKATQVLSLKDIRLFPIVASCLSLFVLSAFVQLNHRQIIKVSVLTGLVSFYVVTALAKRRLPKQSPSEKSTHLLPFKKEIEKSKAPVTFVSLPTDLQKTILSFLEPKVELNTCTLISKEINKLIPTVRGNQIPLNMRKICFFLSYIFTYVVKNKDSALKPLHKWEACDDVEKARITLLLKKHFSKISYMLFEYQLEQEEYLNIVKRISPPLNKISISSPDEKLIKNLDYPSITELTLDKTNLDVWKHLLSYINLTSLYLNNLCDIKDFSSLENFINLTYLSVWSSYLEDVEIPLKKLKTLTTFQIGYCPNFKVGKSLNQAFSLLNLHLENLTMDQLALEELGNLNLVRLSLTKINNEEILSVIKKINSLRTLKLDSLKKIDKVYNLFQLNKLGIYNCKGLDINLLGGMSNLTSLKICNHYSEIDLNSLLPLTQLTDLELNGVGQLSDLSPLAKMKQLKVFKIESCVNVHDFSMLPKGLNVQIGYLMTHLKEKKKVDH